MDQEEILLALISTGIPKQQQNVARRVIQLLDDRGYGYVYEAWDGKIEPFL